MGKKKKKGGKKKGYKKGGKKKGWSRIKKHKPGIAESLGALSTGLKVAKTAVPEARAFMKAPSWQGGETWMVNAWYNLKANAEPLLLGVVVSNVDKLPIVGKMARPFKRKIDRIVRSYTGMDL